MFDSLQETKSVHQPCLGPELLQKQKQKQRFPCATFAHYYYFTSNVSYR